MTIVIDPDLAEPSGTTLDSLIARVRQELIDDTNINVLEDEIDASEDLFALKYPLSSTARGSKLSIEDEVMHVFETSADREVRVLRGYNSTAIEHAAGTLVTIDGKSRKQIIDAINDELVSLWSKGLYVMRSTELESYSPATMAYAVSDVAGQNIYAVEYYDASTAAWYSLTGWDYSAYDSVLNLNGYVPTTRIRVLYKTSFTKLFTGEDDLQSVSGLHEEATDILVWGAVLRLTATEELKRNQFRSQGDTRRPQEVPYRAVSLARNDIAATRDARIIDEKDRLRKRFPNRLGW